MFSVSGAHRKEHSFVLAGGQQWQRGPVAGSPAASKAKQGDGSVDGDEDGEDDEGNDDDDDDDDDEATAVSRLPVPKRMTARGASAAAAKAAENEMRPIYDRHVWQSKFHRNISRV
jgi:hypothetical protein